MGGLNKKSAAQPHLNQSAWIRVCPVSNHSQSLMAGNFAALWPTDPKFLELKDQILFITVSKVQEASSILRIVFTHLKWPHLNRAYLLGVRHSFYVTVCTYISKNEVYTECLLHLDLGSDFIKYVCTWVPI